MLFFFNYYTFSLALGGFIALISGFLVYHNDTNKRQNKTWFLLNVSSAIWSFGYLFMISTPYQNIAILSNKILHQGAIFIPFFYFLFVIALTNTHEKHRIKIPLLLTAAGIFSFFNQTSLFIQGVFPKFIFNYAPDAGPLFIYFTVYFFAVAIYAMCILFQKIQLVTQPERARLSFVLWASILGFLGGGSVFFLTFNINISPFPLLLFSLYPTIIVYAIFRHHLFNVKVITTELLTFTIWTFFLIRLLIADSLTSQLIEGGMLIMLILFGILLIRSVLKEVQTREQIQQLAGDLQNANKELARINQAKSDFISMASHQLKTPLSIIKGYISMTLEGSFGKITKMANEQLEKVFISNERLISLVEDLLNLSRVEEGRMKYDWVEADIVPIVQQIVDEVRITTEHKHLKLIWKPPKEKLFVRADLNKIRNVIFNMADNAIKYTDKGSITITVTPHGQSVRVSVADTGRGISAQQIQKLFTKFTRIMEGTNSLTTAGFGLGMYVARLIVEEHGGRIWAESAGLGKGSTFIVEVPMITKSET